MTDSTYPYRCVAFDAVGTLIQAYPSVPEAYQQIGKKYGCRLSLDDIRTGFHKVFQSRQLSETTSEEEEFRFWKEVVTDVIGEVDQASACFDELYQYFAKPESWSVMPHAETTVKTLLESGIQVAVASNFDTRLHSVLDGKATLERISLRVISSEIGWRKPSSQFYKNLIESAGCESSQVLMVGDDLQNDVIAARNAGLDALHFTPNNNQCKVNVTNQQTQIQSLDQVLQYCLIDK